MVRELHSRRSAREILLALAAVCVASVAGAQTAPVSAGPPDPQLIEDLVAANRILADQGLLDGWGHVSVRHNRDFEPVSYGARGGSPARHCQRHPGI